MQISNNRWMEKQIGMYEYYIVLFSGMLLSNKKE